ncbi:NAD(P)H-binding protein [Kitasatospora sp. NPDC002040]|uniref:NAD(P)H-binding protein n=1 Tax=Kitasatospora sp. NPDC002040 TaxID=3154661 RepID=UPI0033278872
MARILVTGAAGAVGRHVVAELLAAGHEVRALTRRADPGARADGAVAVTGDLTVPRSLEQALAGVESVFLAWPLGTSDGAAEVVGRIARQARRVVLLSSAAVRDVPGRGPESPGRPDAELERLIADSGLRHTFLRPHGFMANTLRWAPEIRADGTVRGYGGAAGLTLIDERDIAAVAARALTEDGHNGSAYDLTGPQSPTQAEQLAIIGRAVGRALRWEELPRAAARERLLGTGWPAGIVDGALDFMAARIDSPEPVSSTVQDVTGAPARTLAAWAAEHAAAFR